jgi:hypothetical protein
LSPAPARGVKLLADVRQEHDFFALDSDLPEDGRVGGGLALVSTRVSK